MLASAQSILGSSRSDKAMKNVPNAVTGGALAVLSFLIAYAIAWAGTQGWIIWLFDWPLPGLYISGVFVAYILLLGARVLFYKEAEVAKVGTLVLLVYAIAVGVDLFDYRLLRGGLVIGIGISLCLIGEVYVSKLWRRHMLDWIVLWIVGVYIQTIYIFNGLSPWLSIRFFGGSEAS